ncbi:MAG: hypothetical protein V2A73_18805, partial [Pseudomonadota bacterium]
MMRDKRSCSILASLGALLLGLVALPASAAETDEEQLASYAVQNRTYRLGHELSLAGGVIPLD